jgi:hypothetical protein
MFDTILFDEPPPMSAASIPAGPRSELAPEAADVRRRLAARTLGDALLLGVAGDALLRVPSWGANFTVWSIGIVVAMLTLARRRQDPVPSDAWWIAMPAVAISLMYLLRDVGSLAAYNTLALIGTIALLASAVETGWRRPLVESRIRDLLHNAVVVGISTAFGMLPLVLSDVSLRQVTHARGAGRIIAGVRAVLFAIPLLLIFGSLFASADPMFARLAAELFHIDAGAIASHLAVTGIIAWLVGGLLRATVLTDTSRLRQVPFPDGALGLTEVSTALGSLVLLFAAFVAVQVRYFFGGDALVQATAGMSYADYARRGFFELVTVAALVLPVLLVANALLRRDKPSAAVVFRGLAGSLLGLLAIIMYSAIARMRLYQSAYGMSTDRLYATVFMGWLAVVFVWFAATVLRGREKPFAAGVLVWGWATLIALNIADPAGFVARANVARAEGGRELDVSYMASLGADAAPTLVQYLVRQPLTPPAGWGVPPQNPTPPSLPLPAPAVAPPTRSDDYTARCEAARRLLTDWAPNAVTDWRSWSFGRSRARSAVAKNDTALRRVAGGDWQGNGSVRCAIQL